MARGSSINIQAGKGSNFAESSREFEPRYLLPQEHRLSNQLLVTADQARAVLANEIAARSARYRERTGQRIQSKTTTHFSAVVNLDAHHGIEDVQRIADHLEQTLGTKVVQIAVHRDEGHMGEDGRPEYNWHAHLEFVGLDEQGASIARKMNRHYLRDLQAFTAKTLNMSYTPLTDQERPRKRLEHREFRESKKRETVTVQPLKNEIADKDAEIVTLRRRAEEAEKRAKDAEKRTEIALEALKAAQATIEAQKGEIERLKANIDDLKSMYAEDRAKLIASGKATQTDYSALKKAHDELKAEATAEITALKAQIEELKRPPEPAKPDDDEFAFMRTKPRSLRDAVDQLNTSGHGLKLN